MREEEEQEPCTHKRVATQWLFNEQLFQDTPLPDFLDFPTMGVLSVLSKSIRKSILESRKVIMNSMTFRHLAPSAIRALQGMATEPRLTRLRRRGDTYTLQINNLSHDLTQSEHSEFLPLILFCNKLQRHLVEQSGHASSPNWYVFVDFGYVYRAKMRINVYAGEEEARQGFTENIVLRNSLYSRFVCDHSDDFQNYTFSNLGNEFLRRSPTLEERTSAVSDFAERIVDFFVPAIERAKGKVGNQF